MSVNEHYWSSKMIQIFLRLLLFSLCWVHQPVIPLNHIFFMSTEISSKTHAAMLLLLTVIKIVT